MAVSILTDLTKCIGCESCVIACKEINGLARDEGKKLSATTWTSLDHFGDVHVRRQCMHCLEPACVSVCPVGALEKSDSGAVIYHSKKCIGCRYCMIGCPFNVPKYEWDSALPLVQKCIFCFDKKLSKGEEPACTAVCPTGATIFGDRDELIDQAKQRIKNDPKKYVNYIYGLKEAGGTSVLYLSAIPFEKLGFKVGIQMDPYPKLTWRVISKLPGVVTVGGVLMVGLWWIIQRREKLGKTNGANGDPILTERIEVEDNEKNHS